jgi:gamma-glutamyltranspeptidase/glutathione hydrolase
MRQNAERLALYPASRAQYLKPDGSAYGPGETLVQRELAASLRRIMRGGPDAFYRGTIVRRMLRALRTPPPGAGDPTLLKLSDFADYRAIWRAPLRGPYKGRTVHAFPPPTSGGVALLQLLGILEPMNLRALGANSAQAIHFVAEAQKLVFADRARYLADPRFSRVPVAGLLDPAYLQARRLEIDPDRAKTFGPGTPPGAETGTTTHISVIDRRGNAVALTCTNEQEFGSAVVAPGTGILLNNELTDFGAPGTANQAAGGKRPRSSMSPTIVEEGRRPVMVLGGAGGVRIIMGVAETVLRHIEFGEPLAAAVDAERWDNGGSGRLSIEDARVPAEALAGLESRGHTLVREGEYGVRPRVQVAGIDLATGDRIAVSDARSDQGSVGQTSVVAIAEPAG